MKGRITFGKSRTAVLGHLAAVLAGEDGKLRSTDSWLEERGFDIGSRGVRDALGDRFIRLGGSIGAHGDPSERGWIREAIDFDATKLNLYLAVVIFPRAEHPESLMERLRSSGRVLRLLRGHGGEVLAFVVYEGSREHEDLLASFEEVEPDLQWITLREVDDGPGADTWLSLAEQAGVVEGFLTE